MALVYVSMDENLRAQVQHLLHHPVQPDRHAHDRRAGAALDGDQLVADRADVVGAVFAVDQKPVVAGGRHDFGRNGLAHAQPGADQGFAGQQAFLEDVFRGRHEGLLRRR
jgi:hypothetical protein